MRTGFTYRLFIIAFILCMPFGIHASDTEKLNAANYNLLKEGKNSLDKGDYDNAVVKLTEAIEKIPIMSDYAFFWRAKAYEGKGDTDRAIADLRIIKQRFKDSPLIKNVRIKEIELINKKKNNPDLIKLLEGFVRDYPSELNIKYAYAVSLKENNETEKAKKIFKEIFISTSTFSKNALNELSPSDITVEDLIKRGDNLNKAWLFKEAEKCLREALQKSQESNEGVSISGEEKILTHNSEILTPSLLKTQILEKLAYSLFMQKRYKEAADIYREINNHYWLARSVFRIGDMKTFESEILELLKTGDKRVASLLIAYGSKKRRDGDIDKALETFDNILSKYPAEKEKALWEKGWTYYLSGNYKNALEIFSQLYETYGDSKYLYWKNKCIEISGEGQPVKAFAKKTPQHRDFYAYLSALKNDQRLEGIEDAPIKVSTTSPQAERFKILNTIGLKREAVSELLYMLKKNPDINQIVYISSHLKELGNYKMAVKLITKVPYSDELHGLLYPIAYRNEVEEASRVNNIDPLLILSVIREESRFDTEARSVAGAMGLMQLMPYTAHKFEGHVKASLKDPYRLYDAKTNILIGSYYLKHLVKTFNSVPIAIAAYNAGENAVRDWLKKRNYNTIDEFIEDIPYDETRNYVKRVLTTYFEYIRANMDRDIDVSTAKRHIGNL